MPAFIAPCGCRIFIASAHVEAFCDGHVPKTVLDQWEREASVDRYACIDILAKPGSRRF